MSRPKFYNIIVVALLSVTPSHVSHASQCRVTCTQIGSLRNQNYGNLLEVTQNRQWENSSGFGDKSLNLIRNKRTAVEILTNSSATFDSNNLPQAVLGSALVAMYIYLVTYDNGTFIGKVYIIKNYFKYLHN